jgi:hypothetical protein
MLIDLSNLMFTDKDNVVPWSGEEQIVNTGIANTLAGNDIITGTAIRGSDKVNNIYNAISGIYNIGTLNTDEGNDLIMGIRNEGEGTENNFSYDLSFGILNERGIINTDDGNDTILGINNIRITGSTSSIFGIDNYFGTINTGNGNDIITGSGLNSGLRGYAGTLNTGNGNDIITGTGKNGIESYWLTFDTSYGDDTIIGNGAELGSGINNIASLNTGDGNDIITGTNTTAIENGTGIVNSEGSFADTPIYNNILETGNGNDIITGIGIIGIANSSTISTGNDDDNIICYGELLNNGWVFLGEGNDLIVADTDLPNGAINNLEVNGTRAGTIDTGDGNDIITSRGVIYNEGVINTGNGSDYIEAVDIVGTGYGIKNNGGAIITGDGNDSIIANEGFASGPNSSGAWFLGEGEDYIKGFGSGDFYGGNGNDTLELTPGTYTVGIWGEAGESPIFTKGDQLMITSEFEKLKAGSTIYDFTSLTAGQIIVVA